MKIFIKQVEKKWDKFSDSEKEEFWQGLESLDAKITQLTAGQQKDFERGEKGTQDAQVFELISDFNDLKSKTVKIIDFKIEDL